MFSRNVIRQLALGLALVALAAAFAAAQQRTTMEGKIQYSGQRIVTIKDSRGADFTYMVDPNALIVLNNKPVRLDELKVGALATITLELREDQIIAVAIIATARFP